MCYYLSPMIKTLLILLAFSLAGLTTGTIGYFHSRFHKITPLTDTLLVEIPRGSSGPRVGRILQNSGAISHARHYSWYLRWKGASLLPQSGFFHIPPGLTLAQIAELLASGRTAVLRVTIPEGRASWEIWSILQQTFPNLDSVRWDSLVHNGEFARSLGVESPTLEGWLFPDTYPIPYGADERTILQQMVRSMQACLRSLENKPGSTLQELGGWHQVLTLAAIVEEETGLPGERAQVSGVFHNRLRLGMSLGADPTVRFIFRNITGPIFKSQLESDNPYNTRKFRGLPPGPISNPGRAAIEATLWPMQTSDLYFVAKDDGSAAHWFSTTYAQHNIYKDQAARNRGE